MRVKCIDKKSIEHICDYVIIGQYYLASNDKTTLYPYVIYTLENTYIISLNPEEYHSCFISINELRDNKIDEILT